MQKWFDRHRQRAYISLCDLFVDAMMLENAFLMGVAWQWIDDAIPLRILVKVAEKSPFGKRIVDKMIQHYLHPFVCTREL